MKRPMVLVGPSLGGAAAIDFAVAHPEAVGENFLNQNYTSFHGNIVQCGVCCNILFYMFPVMVTYKDFRSWL